MIIRCLCCFLILGLLTGTSPGQAAIRDLCQAPDDITGSITALPNVADVLKPGGTLRVLAVGSATMFGPEASMQPGTLTSQAVSGAPGTAPPPEKPLPVELTETAFPRRMAAALTAANPGLHVDVVLRGGRGMTAGEMLALLRKELEAGKFQLVLWQTGTVEAVRNTPTGEFAQILSDGAEAVAAAGANLVLIDPQYSRFLQANSNLDPYTQALQQTASMPGVMLFHRFDLMRSWANDAQIDLERTPKPDRRKMAEALHSCLGSQLARMVMAGARS